MGGCKSRFCLLFMCWYICTVVVGNGGAEIATVVLSAGPEKQLPPLHNATVAVNCPGSVQFHKYVGIFKQIYYLLNSPFIK
jgi:hypothetical protein